MPLSLIKFRVTNVGLTSLPYVFLNSDCTTTTSAVVFRKSSLRIVQINGWPNLISLDGFLQQGNIDLQDIEELTIVNCEKLMHLPTQRFENLTSLKYFSLIYCPNLTRCHNLPHSITNLEIDSVGVSLLPEYNTRLNSSGSPSTTSLELCLKNVTIANCPNITSLNGFLQQENIEFKFIRSICIRDCGNLLQLPRGAFGKFENLEYLSIVNCPMLLAVDEQSKLLPVILKNLTIENCGELDVQLLESASHLTTLTYLRIKNCANITHIPCSENAFRSLHSLHISACDKLVEHLSREPAHDVNLHGSNLASLKIDWLYIDDLSLLRTEPLRSLRFVSDLTIMSCSGMDAFSEEWLLQNNNTLKRLAITRARTLKSLPATIARFTVFTALEISECDLLEEIEELPPSLRILSIHDAKSLKSLPTTISSLTSLEELYIFDADLLEEMPELPASLKVVHIYNSKGEKPFT